MQHFYIAHQTSEVKNETKQEKIYVPIQQSRILKTQETLQWKIISKRQRYKDIKTQINIWKITLTYKSLTKISTK